MRSLRHREVTVGDKKVRLLRVGMAGMLAYEMHGALEDALPAYRAVFEAGEPLGMRRPGIHAYLMNHTENGFPQALFHFPPAWATDAGFAEYLIANDMLPVGGVRFAGSLADAPELQFRNPVELGWGHMIRLDHEFTGRDALAAEVEKPTRTMVTLAWDHDDLVELFASQFGEGDEFAAMDFAGDHAVQIGHGGTLTWHADRALKDGQLVGVSSGRIYSLFYKETISLCSLNTDRADLGTEVTVLWGDPGSRQKEIRAAVSRFPFLDLERNENVDVAQLARRSRGG